MSTEPGPTVNIDLQSPLALELAGLLRELTTALVLQVDTGDMGPTQQTVGTLVRTICDGRSPDEVRDVVATFAAVAGFSIWHAATAIAEVMRDSGRSTVPGDLLRAINLAAASQHLEETEKRACDQCGTVTADPAWIRRGVDGEEQWICQKCRQGDGLL